MLFVIKQTNNAFHFSLDRVKNYQGPPIENEFNIFKEILKVLKTNLIVLVDLLNAKFQSAVWV